MSDCPNRLECCDSPHELFDYSLNAWPTYTNAEQSVFIPCPPGFSCEDQFGNPIPGITVTVGAGLVTFTPTTKEENDNHQTLLDQKVQQYAQNTNTFTYFIEKPKLYFNKAMDLTCTQGRVSDVTMLPWLINGVFHVDAGLFSSTISVEDANAKAVGAALVFFELFADCHWINAEVTLSCPTGAEGGPITVPAGHDISYISQEDADAKALAYAQAQIPSVCLYWNDMTTCDCTPPATGGPFSVPAHTYSSNVSKAAANALADADCAAQVAAGCTSCTDHPVNDLVWTKTGDGTGSGSGGSASGSVAQPQDVELQFTLQNSCNAYTVNISVPYTITALDGVFGPPGASNTVIEIFDIDNAVALASDQVVGAPFPAPAACSTKSGTLSVNIALNAFGVPPTSRNLQIALISQPVGFPPTGCSSSFTATLTPLFPP